MTDTPNNLSRRAADIGQRLQGWLLLAPGETMRAVSQLDRRSLGWWSLALAAILALSLNLIASMMFRNMRADLTADRLFTISDGTKKVLSKLDEPINVRVYYTKKVGEVAPLFAKYFERVKALLEQYRDLSRGRLQVTFLDPEPFSDAEDRAVAAGLKGVRLNQDGDTGYFGLTATNTTDNDAVIEFFSPDRERFLEYDLTKLINGLANPKKKVVGMIAGIGIDGGANPMNPMRQPTPPWMVMEQIREFFEVRTIEQTAKEIPADIDVLMLVQPAGLSKETAYAVDQYALGGGRVLAFVDPHAEASPQQGMPGMPPMPQAMSPEIKKLLGAWGLQYDDTKIVGDPTIARRVQFGGRGGRNATVSEYLPWLGIEKSQINEKDPLAGGVEKLNFASAGALSKTENATTIIQPIIETTAAAGLIDVDQVRFQPDPLAIRKAFKPGGRPLLLAARVAGEGKSAYPEGRPKAEEKKADGTKPEESKADDKKVTITVTGSEKPKEDVTKDATPKKEEPAKTDAAKTEAPKIDAPKSDAKPEDKAASTPAAEKPKDDAAKSEPAKPVAETKTEPAKSEQAKPAPTKSEPAKPEPAKAADAAKTADAKIEPAKPAEPEKPHVASGRLNVIVVADSDMLADQFWVEAREFLGQQLAIPQAHNAAFVVNALENLSGGEALAGLRGRGISERPFDRVNQIRRDSEAKFRQKEEGLVAKLKDLQEKLAKVETKGGEGGTPVTVLLTEKDKQTVETFKSEMLNVRRELRDVKADLRRDIDRLAWWMSFLNIAAVPLLIGAFGLGLAVYNRRRPPSAAA